MLPLEQTEPLPRLCWPLQGRIVTFYMPEHFDKNAMITSLLHYSMQCCEHELVEDLTAIVEDISVSSKTWHPSCHVDLHQQEHGVLFFGSSPKSRVSC